MLAHLSEKSELPRSEWQQALKKNWYQGEHIVLIGPTGTGKTTLAQPILEIREWVAILAVKRTDDTLDRFIDGEDGYSRYKVIRKWPPDYGTKKVILWPRPKDIGAHDDQANLLYHCLNKVYMSGGWTVYFDEAGYISASLGLGKALGVLLNQGRSSGITIVATMTRPSSAIAHVPKEALTQCRHVIVFKYTELRELKTCADIAGISLKLMQEYQDKLQWRVRDGQRYSDFLYIHNGTVSIVRNEE